MLSSLNNAEILWTICGKYVGVQTAKKKSDSFPAFDLSKFVFRKTQEIGIKSWKIGGRGREGFDALAAKGPHTQRVRRVQSVTAIFAL